MTCPRCHEPMSERQFIVSSEVLTPEIVCTSCAAAAAKLQQGLGGLTVYEIQ